MTASIGAALFRGDHPPADDLLRQADLAVRRARDAGGNRMSFFDPRMETALRERSSLESDLRSALREGQLVLYFQTQISEGRLQGAEALLRWRHPARGLVQPAEFIPLAEETGLILPLGAWVIERACEQIVEWSRRSETEALTLAVNVSAQQFAQDDFVESVVATLLRTGANPHRLKIELTESLLVSSVDTVVAKMAALKARGVSFSLDDFGTGYSSLAYLKRLPLDQVKIDRSFVLDVLSNPNDAAIVRTIVALAQTLGLEVIAEGVETEQQRDFLARSRCHSYQGHFFSRPVPIDEFERLVPKAAPALLVPPDGPRRDW